MRILLIVFAIGQEARGAHFLSHDLVSACIAWFLLVAIYSWMLLPRTRRLAPPAPAIAAANP